MASRGAPRWKLVSETALASGHPPSSTPATAEQCGQRVRSSSMTSPTSTCPSAESTACLQSMKKSLSRPEARTTRRRAKASVRSSSSRRARAAEATSALLLFDDVSLHLLEDRDHGRRRTPSGSSLRGGARDGRLFGRGDGASVRHLDTNGYGLGLGDRAGSRNGQRTAGVLCLHVTAHERTLGYRDARRAEVAYDARALFEDHRFGGNEVPL